MGDSDNSAQDKKSTQPAIVVEIINQIHDLKKIIMALHDRVANLESILGE